MDPRQLIMEGARRYVCLCVCVFFILSVNKFLIRNLTPKRQFQRTTSEIILDSVQMPPKPLFIYYFFSEIYGKNLRLLARNGFYKCFFRTNYSYCTFVYSINTITDILLSSMVMLRAHTFTEISVRL